MTAEHNKVKVYVEKTAYQKLRYYVGECEKEISGFGKIIKRGGDLVVTDFQIFPQEVGSAHSTMDPDGLAKFLYDKTKAGEDLSEWKVWWHSHAKMSVFFSGTDTGTINSSTEFDWLLSIVSNHAGDIEARLDVYEPIRAHVEVDIVVLDEENEALREQCKKEITENVKVAAIPSYTPAAHREELDNEEEGYWLNGKWHKKGKDRRWRDPLEDMEDRD